MPGMTSTGPTEGASAFSEKERTPIENKMRQEIAKAFREYMPEAEIAVREGEEPDYDPLRKAIIIILTTYLIRAFMDRVMELEEEYDIAFDPADMSAAATAWAATFAPEEADRLIATTQKVVGGVAVRYAAEEITADQIEELLDPAFNKNRAGLIAITLITVAASMAEDEYISDIRAMGYQIREYWETREDERVCSICSPLHNTTRDVWGAEFPEGPPAHGRCRCSRRFEIFRV